MEAILNLIHPRSTLGMWARFSGFVGLMAVANIVFATLYDGRLLRDPVYYVSHAVFVGGPFTAFFSLIMILQMKLHQKLSLLSQTDGLTGLKNRRTFLDLTERHRQASKDGVLLLLDADNFKSINDAYGHQAGDNCLQSISHTLARSVRSNDVVGRIGGEEFAIFLADATLHQARVIGERITRPIPYSADTCNDKLTVTLSVGAVLACREKSLDALFAQADEALYKAKADGRARMVLWDEALMGVTASPQAC